MDRNKKQNSVRYKCQVRDINKKSVSNTRFNLTFVLSRKLLGRSPAAPFFMQLSRQLCRRCARRQRHKCRSSVSYVDARIGALLEVENEENIFNSNIWNYFIFFICCSIWLKNGNDFR